MDVTKSLLTLILDLPPSCIQVCPFNRPAGYFLVGTYELQTEQPAEPQPGAAEQDGENNTSAASKSQTRRNGSIILLKWNFERREICHLQTFPQPAAVLHLQFRPESESSPPISKVAAAYSDGKLRIFDFSHLSSEPTLQLQREIDVGVQEGVLLTFCAWHPSRPDLIAVTTTAGEVLLLRLNDDGALAGRTVHGTHYDQAWYVAMMDSPSPHVDGLFLFSGADDSKLQSAIYRLGEEEDPDLTPRHVEAVTFKGHSAGVTAILPLLIPDDREAFLLLTGSYDEYMRLFTLRSDGSDADPDGPDVISPSFQKLQLGGGVWRLQLVQSSTEPPSYLILASCMHAGARVVRIIKDNMRWTMEMVQKFEEHESMNYGSDVIYPLSEGDVAICLSTSFYDRRLCAWEINIR